MDTTQDDMNDNGLDRRSVLRRGAAGAGATAAALAVPSVTGIGVAPSFAQACTPTPPPVVTVDCASVAGSCNEAVAVDLVASNVVANGNALVSDNIVPILTDSPTSVTSQVAVSLPPLCPGDVLNAVAEVTIDLCQLFNDQLAGAIAASPVTVLDLDIALTGVTVGGVAVPDFAQNGVTPIAACPQVIEIPVTVSLPPVGAPVEDPATCTYTCPPAPTAADVVVSPSTFDVTSMLDLTVQVDFLGIRGGATADFSGTSSIPAGCSAVPVVTVTCTPA